jgi:hypothetical protein
MQVLYQLKRHNALLRVTVFGVLPEQQHAHTVGNETYGFLHFVCCASHRLIHAAQRYVDLFGKHCDEQAVVINSYRIDVLVELNGQVSPLLLQNHNRNHKAVTRINRPKT